jgi:hypothetical protein
MGIAMVLTVRIELSPNTSAIFVECRDLLVRVLASVTKLKDLHMSTQAELKAELQLLTEAVSKIGAESASTLAQVTALEAAIAAGGATTPEIDEALAALKAQVKLVDDLVIDVP